jgi:hypothetical protein
MRLGLALVWYIYVVVLSIGPLEMMLFLLVRHIIGRKSSG